MTDEIKPVAYMTEHEQGPMLWLDRQEALSYSDEETPPIELVPADQVRAAVLEAKEQERERLALAWEWAHGFDKYGVAAFIRSGHSITETQRAEE